MSTLGLINGIKEQPASYQPLMLAEFAMPDGSTVLRLATHDLTPSGFQYNGNGYLPRILNQDMAAFQLVSQQGISVPPTVSLKLADADKLLWGYEMSTGFRGAVLNIRFVFWNVGTGSFSADAVVYGPFLCSAASNVDDTSLTIPAGSKLNMEQIQAPFIHIQQTCPWSFPATAAQRLDGATNELSDFWQCGYSPDVSPSQGGCGNYQSGTTPYSTCGYTKGDCVNRGMYIKDSASNKTGRFGGMQFQPPTALKSRSYLTGNWQEIYNNLNESKYGDFVPMLYGTQWVDCPVIVSTGDANEAKFEVIVCYGQAQGISQVVLNDTLIPCAVDLDGTSYPVQDVAFCWRCINNGQRSGAPNADTLFNGLGDPYGSYCAIEIVVPVALATSASVPHVRVETSGPLVQVFSGVTGVSFDGTYAYVTIAGSIPPLTFNQAVQFTISGTGVAGLDKIWLAPLLDWNYVGGVWIVRFPCTLTGGPYTGLSGTIEYPAGTSRPPWVLLDFLLWCGWDIADINMPSFMAADAACGVPVSYADQNGNTQTKDRYKYQNVLRQRRSAAQATRGMLGCMNGVAVPNSGGALTLVVKQTLADQQPTLPDGSNYSTAVASLHADGTAGNGYVAYAFDESNIIRDNEGRGKPKFNIVQRANPDLPALVTVNWQDEDNQYVVDSLTLADLPALQRVSQNTTAAPPAEGFANYDQVRRIVNTWFAENAWGNPRNDPGGTFQVQLTTTFKGVKLQIGQVVMLSWKQAGISQQLFRILQLKPSTDFETVDLLLQWHEDAWYTNAYGQATTPGGNGSGSMLPMRPPYPIMIGEYGDAINPLHPGAN
ncbi:MAG: phage tail protein, partial [Bryobacteraceae bacterium]